MRKLFKGLAVALALTSIFSMASAAENITATKDQTFDLTVDTTGIFTTDEKEYGRGFFQEYVDESKGVSVEITGVSITYNGEKKDVTDFAILDGSDGNFTLYLTPERDKKTDEIVIDGVFENASTLDKVTAITYSVKLVGDWTDEAWWGGAIGTNSTAGWQKAGGAWTTATEADDKGKDYYIAKPSADAPAATETKKPDANAKTGDATNVAVLAIVALVAMGGAVVVSKKRA